MKTVSLGLALGLTLVIAGPAVGNLVGLTTLFGLIAMVLVSVVGLVLVFKACDQIYEGGYQAGLHDGISAYFGNKDAEHIFKYLESQDILDPSQ